MKLKKYEMVQHSAGNLVWYVLIESKTGIPVSIGSKEVVIKRLRILEKKNA